MDEMNLDFNQFLTKVNKLENIISNNIKDKEAFEKSLTKQVEMNIDFWSYMLVYDSHINDNTLILSMDIPFKRNSKFILSSITHL
mgnify:CR=1 FL=1